MTPQQDVRPGDSRPDAPTAHHTTDLEDHTVTTETTPRRVQRTRTAGQRGIPTGAVYVGRSAANGGLGRWGNPFRVVRVGGIWTMALPDGRACGAYASPADAARAATEEFRAWIHTPEQADLLAAARSDLVGKDLACWCKPGLPCHADVLLEITAAVRAEGGA